MKTYFNKIKKTKEQKKPKIKKKSNKWSNKIVNKGENSYNLLFDEDKQYENI